MAADDFPVGQGVEDCKIVIGVGVNGMKETKKADGVWCLPELEDSVDMEEVVKKGSEPVPAFTGAGGTQDGQEGWQVFVHRLEFFTEERTS